MQRELGSIDAEATIIKSKRKPTRKKQKMMEITCSRFEGWILECPHCRHKEYISEEEIAFNPIDDQTHIVKCEKCKREFEIEIGV